jgi:hypothetical protein
MSHTSPSTVPDCTFQKVLQGIFLKVFCTMLQFMLTLKELQARLALTEWPLRRLLDALQPLLTDMMHRKQGQAIRVDSAAIGLLERAKELMGKGVPRSMLVQVLQGEMQEEQQDVANARVGDGNNEQSLLQVETELVGELKNVIQFLRDDNAWLKQRLHEKEEQLQLILPSESKSRLSFTQRIKAVVHGHI